MLTNFHLKKTHLFFALLSIVFAGIVFLVVNSQNASSSPIPVGNNGVLEQDVVIEEEDNGDLGAVELAQWFIFDNFTGFKTKADPSKIDNGANPNGQNTIINDGDRVSVRDFGFTLFGQASTTQTQVEALHTFRRRDGENIMMRAAGTYLQYFEEANDEWFNLATTTGSAQYDFADYNINTDLRSYVYFGNAVDPFSRWSGAHVTLSAALTGGETLVATTDTTGVGFPATGSIVYCDLEVAYTAVASGGFTVASAHACTDADAGVTQAIEEFASAPLANIYLVANNRLFISGIATSTQAVFFSAYGDATDFVDASLITNSTVASPGIFNLGEGGGGVTGIALDEGSIYIFKRSVIYQATLDGDGLYTLIPLKPFDGNSQTTGAVSSGSVFTGGNGVFFITPDNQIMDLTRVSQVDYPQIIPISDIIKPTVDTANFASSTGIFFKNNGYISAQGDDTTTRNDTVFLWNDRVNAWESPIVGWSASVFTIYDDGDSEELYFGDSRIAQVYKVTDDAIDNDLGITANWRSKRFDFNEPHQRKELDNFFIEGYISDNTTLNISLLLDENGDSQILTTEFAGTEEDFLYDAPVFNLFGFHPFGFERFGSQDAPDTNKFRVYLNKNLRRTPFYNIQIEFASDGVGQDWEIISYGFEVRRATQSEDRNLYRSF